MLGEAVADIEASFAGGYGEFWPGGSAVAGADGEPVAARLAVRRVPWERTPARPFVIELFTARAFRRRGLDRALLARGEIR